MRWAPRTRPARCGFAVESMVGAAVHRAAPGMPHAAALHRKHLGSGSTAAWPGTFSPARRLPTWLG